MSVFVANPGREKTTLSIQYVRKVVCPDCSGFVMGSVYVKNRKSYLIVSEMWVRNGFRICPVCGNTFHFHGDEEDKKFLRGVDTAVPAPS